MNTTSTTSNTEQLEHNYLIRNENTPQQLQGEIIYTQGLPGSGKSTAAKKLLEELLSQGKKAVQIELDEMRVEFGVSPNNREGEQFNKLLQERNRRINNFLNKGYTVILSDTFMTAKAIKEIERLGKQKNVSKVTKLDFTHVPVELCVQRDNQRQAEGKKYAGEQVIRKMYQAIRPDDPLLTHLNSVVIGDIHGDYSRLKKLLNHLSINSVDGKWINPLNIFLVFLGDLNDTRLGTHEENLQMSSYKVLKYVKELCDLGWATCVQSNHGFNLIHYLKGRRKKADHGLDYTVNELTNLKPEEVNELLHWMDMMPYFYSFMDNNKRKVTCVHAQYTEGMSQYHPEGSSKNLVMYGKHLEGVDERGYRLRVPWWNEVSVPENELYICGHYHEFNAVPDWKSPKVILLDSGAGSDGGTLSSYHISPSGSNVITV
jgi:adenylylsulfate kinase-like enzyme